MPSAAPPRLAIQSAHCRALSSATSTHTTRAPSSASPWAMPPPMLGLVPVTIATLLARRVIKSPRSSAGFAGAILPWGRSRRGPSRPPPTGWQPWRRGGSCAVLARGHGGGCRRRGRPIRLQRASREAQALIVARPLGEVTAKIDQPHVQRAELLRALEVEPLAFEDDQVFLLVGRDDDAGLAVAVIPERLPDGVERVLRLPH